MKFRYTLVFFSVSILLFLSCQEKEVETKVLSVEKFGIYNEVELQFDKIKTWEDLLWQVDSINCDEAIPKITFISKQGGIKSVTFFNRCMYSAPIYTLNRNDAIQVFNDTIFKSSDYVFPLDSLTYVIEKDYYNNGKDSQWSDSSEELIICLSYDVFNQKKLINTLDYITDTYKNVSRKNDVKIWLVNMEYYRIFKLLDYSKIEEL